MMRIGLLVAGAAALLPMVAANAQQAPSENDIFALYCLGVFRASTETFVQSYASAWGIAKTIMFTVRRGEDDGRQCLNWRMNNLEAVLAAHEPQFCKQTDKCGDLSRLPM